ncbi:MAG TPA: outer membrane protein assembly factor BamE [Thermoanaerobaculia bacterium]|jgi:hypothetical protein
MTGRRVRNLLLLALLAGAGYWFYRDPRTPSQLIDDLTRPLMGSRAAVKEDERKRVMNDATNVVTQQTDDNVGMLRMGMSKSEVRDLLGEPDKIETMSPRNPVRVRWDYRTLRRSLVFEDGRIASISIL